MPSSVVVGNFFSTLESENETAKLRQIITRLTILPSSNALTSAEVTASSQPKQKIFYDQSASATTSRPSKSSRCHHPHSTSAASYEVRLSAWNCTCPAFAYSAFGRTSNLDSSPASDDEGSHETADFRFGGMLMHSNEKGAPICEHILAAVLGELHLASSAEASV